MPPLESWVSGVASAKYSRIMNLVVSRQFFSCQYSVDSEGDSGGDRLGFYKEEPIKKGTGWNPYPFLIYKSIIHPTTHPANFSDFILPSRCSELREKLGERGLTGFAEKGKERVSCGTQGSRPKDGTKPSTSSGQVLGHPSHQDAGRSVLKMPFSTVFESQ